MEKKGLFRLLILWMALALGFLLGPSSARAGQAGTSKRTSQVGSAVRMAQEEASSGAVTDLYYSQLSEEEKQAYAALAAKDLKQGEVRWYPSVRFVTDRETAEDSGRLRETDPIRALFAQGEKALYAFRLDYMDRVYWMYDCDIDVVWAVTPQDGEKVLVEVRYVGFRPIAYYNGALSEEEGVQAALAQAASAVRASRRGTSRAQTVLSAVTYLAGRASYGNGSSKASHTPAGLLLSRHGRVGNCEGYARVLFCLCKRLQIPVVYVESKSHAFVFVQLENGSWYGVDPSWADTGTSVDLRWVLYGTATARGDSSGAHAAFLSRYGARLMALTIVRDSYVWK